MVAQLIRQLCPSCSHNLRISLKNLGRKVECKFCGHRFRPRVEPDLRPMLAGAGGPVPAAEEPGAGHRQRLQQAVESEIQKTWARFTAKQTSLVEQLAVVAEDQLG